MQADDDDAVAFRVGIQPKLCQAACTQTLAVVSQSLTVTTTVTSTFAAMSFQEFGPFLVRACGASILWALFPLLVSPGKCPQADRSCPFCLEECQGAALLFKLTGECSIVASSA